MAQIVATIRTGEPDVEKGALVKALNSVTTYLGDELGENHVPGHVIKCLAQLQKLVVNIEEAMPSASHLVVLIGNRKETAEAKKLKKEYVKAINTVVDHLSNLVDRDEKMVPSYVVISINKLTHLSLYIVKAAINDDDHLTH